MAQKMISDNHISEEKMKAYSDLVQSSLTAVCVELQGNHRLAMIMLELMFEDICYNIDRINRPAAHNLDATQAAVLLEVMLGLLKNSEALISKSLDYYTCMIGLSEMENQLLIQEKGEPYLPGQCSLQKWKERHTRWINTLLPFMQKYGFVVGGNIYKTGSAAH